MPECGRCEAEFEESELIQRTPMRHGMPGKTKNFCGYCFLASEVARNTRGPIQPRDDMAVHPVRVYSRALAKVVQKRNGKEHELEGAYDRLLTDTLEEHAPDWLKDNLLEAEKAVKAELKPFDERGSDDEDSSEQQTLN